MPGLSGVDGHPALTHRSPEQTSPWRTALGLAAALALIFLYYWVLVSDGRLLDATTTRYGLVFNSMLEHMRVWRFDVDPDVIGQEGFTRDGHTYAYFGIVMGLLRLPLLAFPRLAQADITALSCAIAATLAALGEILAIRHAGTLVAAFPGRRPAVLLLIVACVLGGPQVQFLRPSMYQEPITWAAAMAAIFIWLMFRWCTATPGRRSSHLIAMALLAGLCLNTRVSTSLGLYAALGGVLLIEGMRWLYRRRRPMVPSIGLGALLAAALVLLAFMLVCGYVNYERWGNPLTFQDYRYYNTVAGDESARQLVQRYGFFNAQRIPFGLGYYFLPIWALIRPDEMFLFREFQSRLMFLVEPPPTSFLLSDLALCVAAALGVLWLLRPRAVNLDTAAARLAAAALCLPGGLMLIAMAVTFRYRGEFYQGFLFLALFGMVAAVQWFSRRTRLAVGLAAALVAFSIAGAHVDLFVYKITPWGDYLPVEQMGWTRAYTNYLVTAFPTLSRYVRPD